MTKTAKAIEIIDQQIKAGRTHMEAARAAEEATDLLIYSEGPAGTMGEGQAYVDALQRGACGTCLISTRVVVGCWRGTTHASSA